MKTRIPPHSHVVILTMLCMMCIAVQSQASNSMTPASKLSCHILDFKTPWTSFLAPPPPVYQLTSVTVINVTCPNLHDGSIEIDLINGMSIPGATAPYEIIFERRIDHSDSYLLIDHIYNSNSNSQLYHNLIYGYYHIVVIDALGNSWEKYVSLIEDNTLWPIQPVADRAGGVDIKTDNNGNVFATGYFGGSIIFKSLFYTSPNENNGYLVRFDPCGNVVWDKQFGQNGDCTPTALCIDGNGFVIVSGIFKGNIDFSNTISLNSLGIYQNGFVAKFNPTNGNCIWAVQFKCDGSLRAKDITADVNGDIFLLGDFDGVSLEFYNSGSPTPFSSVLSPMNPTQPYTDLYLAVINANGAFQWADNWSLSTQLNDKAGGICCATHPDLNATDIYVTGMNNNTDFFARHFLWDNSASMTYNTFYVINLISEMEGTSVAVYDDLKNKRHISFSGNIFPPTIIPNTSFPFINTTVVDQNYPGLQFLTLPINLINNGPVTYNYSTDIAINQFTGETFVSGGFNESGNIPSNPGTFCPQDATINNPLGEDFFLFAFNRGTSCSQQLSWWASLYSVDFLYPATTELVSGICANKDINRPNTSFLTGAFNGDEMEVFSGFPSLPLSIFPTNPTGLSNCFISRVFEDGGPYFHFKSTESNNQINIPTAIEDRIKFYPNPAKSGINISVSGNTDIFVKTILLDLTGKKVADIYSGPLNKSGIDIDIRYISSGMYFLNIESEGRSINNKLLVL